MSYTETLGITVPAALYDIACAIARALDPDIGGAASYGQREQGDPPAAPEFYSTSTPCTPEFKAQSLQLLQLPEALHAVVATDYAARWGDMKPPTLEDCEMFCALAVVSMPEPEPKEATE